MTLSQQLRRARDRYMADPSKRRLRWYLVLKGRAGRWDARMNELRLPVDVSPAVLAFFARAYGAGLIPTSTTGGQHAPHSLHYLHRAGDVGLRGPEIGTARGIRRMSDFQRAEFKRGGHRELIGPVNDRIILAGFRMTLPEGSPLEQQHDNHVHGGF